MRTEVILLNEKMVRERLIKYLSRDATGVRRKVLEIFLNGGRYTTEEIYNILKKEGFDVNYRGVSAMVGLMNTRLGILRIDVGGEHNLYSLKETHRNVLKSVLESS